ncbi:MAG: lysyl-tRNA synthetase [Candidatus Parcubacteria bacterium]|jgi:lysyl-tRNA synthetase class 2
MTLEEIRALRVTKVQTLRDGGADPYPAATERTHTLAEVHEQFDELMTGSTHISIAGRLMSVRAHGGSIFCDIFDGTEKIQIYLKQDDLGDVFIQFENLVDSGDFIEAHGTVFVTKRGQKSLLVTTWKLLSKSLLPIPTEWFGIQDEDDRFRKRYLDILLDRKLAERFTLRSKFWNTMRSYLLEKNFIEVETPVIENTTGGADARPFASHHNALDIDVFFRISAGELWQKRLMVAGLPRTFEIGRIFRNEGMSPEHAQDYTQIEFYMAYADYRDGMKMIQEMYRKIAHEVFGTSKFTIKGFEVDLEKEWETYHFCEIIKARFNVDPLDEQLSLNTLAEKLKEAGVEFKRSELNRSRGVDLLWKSIRKTLGGPGFLIGVPVYLEPLAKRSPEDNRVVERFQVILAGSEMGKGFSELNDPIDQRARFEEQQSMRDAGDEEAQMADWEYVEAMEYGMPPTFGFGVSERLFSFLLDVPIREAQLFPLMRPKQAKLSNKEAEAQYRSKRFVVIADPSQGYGVAANAIGQLGISIGGLLKTKLFDQTVFLDKDGNKHYADGLYPMTNLAGSQAHMVEFVLKCHTAGIQVHDFSQIMKTAHSDAEMEKGYKAKSTAEVPYIAVGALVPADFEKEFLQTLTLFGKE